MAAKLWQGGMADGPKKKRIKKAPPSHGSDGRKHTPKSSNPKVGEVTKTTGKPKRSGAPKRNPKVDTTTWRRKLQASRIKFDDVAKEIFLGAFRLNNLKMRAADQAGVALATVNEHLKNDPDFASAYDEAVAVWRDFVVDKAIVKIALEGNERRRKDKEGNVIEEWTEHPVPLLLAELKRVDHGFRESSTLDVNTGGGVLIAPSDMEPADWLALQREKNESRKSPMEQEAELAKAANPAPPPPKDIELPDRRKVLRG